MLPDIVQLRPAQGRGRDAVSYDPARWPGRLDRFADEDGLLLIIEAGDAEHRLWLPGPEPLPGTPLAAILDLDAHAAARADAALRLWRLLSGRPAPRTPARKAPGSRSHRLARTLQALDGHLAGATYREIAAAVFGEARLRDADPWRTSSLRGATIGLVESGRALMSGGYRSLLHSSLR